MTCLFCDIIAKKIPASDPVFEDSNVMAIRDINPQAPVHLLIIPKKHIDTINEVEVEDTALMGQLVHTAKQLAKQEGMDEPGYRLVFNVNLAGGQEIRHIHLHMLGGRQMTWPPG